jgi:hypothetical protein
VVASSTSVLAQAHLDFPSCLRQRERTLVLDSWVRGEQNDIAAMLRPNSSLAAWQGGVYQPDSVDDEYEDLQSRSPNAFAGLVVKSMSQMLYVDGVRRPGSRDNLKVWETWQRNEWDAMQIPLTRSTIGHGLAFASAMPGKDPFTGDKLARLRAYPASRMAAFYEEPDDQWPLHVMHFRPYREVGSDGVTEKERGWNIDFVDNTGTHKLKAKGDGADKKEWSYVSYVSHDLNVTPFVRYANSLDLDGLATGEIEPVIPLLRRLDQGTFDRLIVQRFGAWKVRYIAGLAKPKDATDEEYVKLKLRIADLLVSPDKETKFGTLDATDISGFLSAIDNDLRQLAAITQTPPHHLLGLSSNLQAEALAAAEGGLLRKAGDFKTFCGESHEKLLRLAAHINGDTSESRAWDMEVRWRDTESRSLVQTVNALGIAATALKIPVEMLWERIPGWTDQDSERAKDLVESGDLMETLFAELEAEQAADAAKQMADAVPPTPVVGKGTGGSDRGAK